MLYLLARANTALSLTNIQLIVSDMRILKKKLHRPNWTKSLRDLKMENDCLEADIKHMRTIRTMATRLKEEGMHFTFQTDGDKVNVWKIPVPARKYKKI